MGAITEEGIVCTQTITMSDIEAYAEMSGDRNPIHQGPDAIAHGALLIGKISAAVWRAYGDGTVARGIDSLKLHRPIRPGEDFNILITYGTEIPGSRLKEKAITVRVTKWCGSNEKLIAEGAIVIIPPKTGNGILNGGGA
jgi:acyl dehydratase